MADVSARNRFVTVELAEIADPVRLGDRLAARDGQRMKATGRLLAVRAKGGEERRVVALADALQDAEVELAEILVAMEHAAKALAQMAGHFLDGRVGDPVDIELGARGADRACELEARIVGVALAEQRAIDNGEVAPQLVVGDRRSKRDVTAHDARLDVIVEQDTDQRVLEGRNANDVVHEAIAIAAQRLQGRLEWRRVAERIDDEDLEVRHGPRAIGTVRERVLELGDARRERLVVVLLVELHELVDRVCARKREVALERAQRLERLANAATQIRRIDDGALRESRRPRELEQVLPQISGAATPGRRRELTTQRAKSRPRIATQVVQIAGGRCIDRHAELRAGRRRVLQRHRAAPRDCEIRRAILSKPARTGPSA